MRSCGSVAARAVALALLVTLAAIGPVGAQSPQTAVLFDEASVLERALRKDIASLPPSAPSPPLVRRSRILIGTYEDIARLFPKSDEADQSLARAVALAADVFGRFKEGLDRDTAVRLATLLGQTHPSSRYLADARARVATLPPGTGAPSAPRVIPPAQATVSPAPVPSPPAQAVVPRPTPSASAPSQALLRAVRRDVRPDVLRISLELDGEVTFREERLAGPPRVFIDLINVRESPDVRTNGLVFDDDVVRQIRIGRQQDRRVRVVLDLHDAPAHSIYTLYGPFRIVIDFERQRTDVRMPLADAVPAIGPAPTAAPAMSAAQPNTALSPPQPPGRPVTAAPAIATRPGSLSMSRQLGLGVGRIVIDPGHGGHDPGARESGVSEAELVLDVALRLEQLLLKSDVEVVLTRRTNVFLPLEERPAVAVRERADLYLSIHANASTDTRARGVETYVLNFAPNAANAALASRENRGSTRTMRDLSDLVRTIALTNKIDESRALAKLVQASLFETLSKVNRAVRNLGVKQAPFAVLIGTETPAILSEVAFISNKQEAALVKTPAYRQRIADALATGILRYQNRLKPPQVAQQ